MVYKISLKLWDDEKIARYAAIILSSTLSYLLWSALIMFDIVLTFWVLLAIYGLLSTAGTHNIKSWLLIGIAIGGGILTKGPVVFVYILPVVILAFLWVPKEGFTKRWYAWFLLSLAVGIALVLLWLIPAAMTGGKTYREAILWGQTVNRVANSFAHQRPFWWYLPWLLALLLPWILLTPVWRGCSRLTNDRGGRFLIIWIAPALVVLSLISGKQVHYLIPMLPPFCLLVAKNLAAWESGGKIVRWHYPVAVFYTLLGIVLLAVSFTKTGGAFENIGISGIRSLAFGLIVIGAALSFLKKQSTSGLINYTALSSAAFFVLILFSGNTFFDRYDLRGISGAIKEKQDAGFNIMHSGKYHGQYQFIGRLTRPLVPMETVEAIGKYAANHDNVALITYEPKARTVNQEDIYFQQPFRNKKVVLWNRKGISNLVKLPDAERSEE
jgi:4-amino-4-deoxy-L-arabinose transferase-like glycosyltransferase